MPHVVYITNGMSSTLNSSLELSRRLVDAGHRVTYLSHADVEETVRANGHPFHRLRRDREFVHEAAAMRPGGPDGARPSPGSIVRWVGERRRLRHESARLDELEGLLASLQPDVVILDYELHAAIVTVSALGLPMVLAIVWFTIFRDPELPPMQFLERPPNSAAGRARMRLLWLRSYWGGVRDEWMRRFTLSGLRVRLSPVTYGTLLIEDLRAVARARGFDARRFRRTDWLRPATYPTIPTLCFNLQEMDFPHRPHPSLHYVGPMVARGRVEVRSAGSDAKAWAAFKARRAERGDAERPLVYCSLGSHWSADETLLRKVLEAFARRPGWDLVIGLGSKLDPEALAPVPSNALVIAWAPQLEVLAEADAAITHGGITTINECVAFGVPMLVYSTAYVDQNGCAARVEHHGLGVVADRHHDTSHDIERNLDHVMRDPDIRRNVGAMRRRLLEIENGGSAVATVERFMRPRPDRQTRS